MFKDSFWFSVAKQGLVKGLLERDFRSNTAMLMRFPVEFLCMYTVLMSCAGGVDRQVLEENELNVQLYSLEQE